jgi:putative transposase
MAFINIAVHLVWSTHRRIPYLHSSAIRRQTWTHIYEYCVSKGIFIRAVSGYADHCHCLVSLKKNQSVSEIVKLIKGESAHWININVGLNQKFNWQKKYYAVAVSRNAEKALMRYINSQERHHGAFSYKEEYEEFVSDHFGEDELPEDDELSESTDEEDIG